MVCPNDNVLWQTVSVILHGADVSRQIPIYQGERIRK